METISLTGACGAIPASDEKRRNAHAKLFYEEMRNRTTDVTTISKNTGWDIKKIEKIKNHIFLTKHDLGYDEPVTFDPDYNMAVSWQRLIDGKNIKEEDYILLEHEYLELNIMEKENLKYNEAHIKANETFDYASIIKHKENTL